MDQLVDYLAFKSTILFLCSSYPGIPSELLIPDKLLIYLWTDFSTLAVKFVKK